MFKKIDIYTRNRFGNRVYQYMCSTHNSPTCKHAKERFCKAYGLSLDQVKTCFAK